jgi:hypothetical protein
MAKLKVESAKSDKEQDKLIKEAEENLKALREEMATKKYPIDLKVDGMKMLLTFITDDAKWKFTECLGIIEVEREINDCIKTGKVELPAVAVEAIYYYMSKVEGEGKNPLTTSFKTLDQYINILKEITGGIELIKADGEKIREAEFILAARREGVDTDTSVTKAPNEKS